MVSGCDGIVLGYDTNAAITSRIIHLAEKYDKPIYGLVGNMGVLLRHTEYLRKTTCFICNEMEAGRLFREDLVELTPEGMLEALKRGSAVAGIPSMRRAGTAGRGARRACTAARRSPSSPG